MKKPTVMLSLLILATLPAPLSDATHPVSLAEATLQAREVQDFTLFMQRFDPPNPPDQPVPEPATCQSGGTAAPLGCILDLENVRPRPMDATQPVPPDEDAVGETPVVWAFVHNPSAQVASWQNQTLFPVTIRSGAEAVRVTVPIRGGAPIQNSCAAPAPGLPVSSVDVTASLQLGGRTLQATRTICATTPTMTTWSLALDSDLTLNPGDVIRLSMRAVPDTTDPEPEVATVVYGGSRTDQQGRVLFGLAPGFESGGWLTQAAEAVQAVASGDNLTVGFHIGLGLPWRDSDHGTVTLTARVFDSAGNLVDTSRATGNQTVMTLRRDGGRDPGTGYAEYQATFEQARLNAGTYLFRPTIQATIGSHAINRDLPEVPLVVAAGGVGVRLHTGESTTHTVRPGLSTTYLVVVNNTNPQPVTLRADFVAEQGTPWGLVLATATSAAGDQVTLDGDVRGREHLLRVTAYPPSGAAAGTAVRFHVRLVDTATGSVRTTPTFQIQVQDLDPDAVRQVELFTLLVPTASPGSTAHARVWAWNRGADIEGIVVGANVTAPPGDDATARVLPDRVTVQPGDAVPVDVAVTLRAGFPTGTPINVSVEGVSEHVATVRDQVSLTLEVPRVTSFSAGLLATDGTRQREATRFVKVGFVDFVPIGTPPSWSLGAYHEIQLENTGTVRDSYTVRLASNTLQPAPAPGDNPLFGDPVLTRNPDEDSGNESVTVALDPGQTGLVWLFVPHDEARENDDDGYNFTLNSVLHVTSQALQAAVEPGATRVLTAKTWALARTDAAARDDTNRGFTLIRFANVTSSANLATTARTIELQPAGNGTLQFLVTAGQETPDGVELRVEPTEDVKTLIDRGWAFRLSATGQNNTTAATLTRTSLSLLVPANNVTGELIRARLTITAPAGLPFGTAVGLTLSAAPNVATKYRSSRGFDVRIGALHDAEVTLIPSSLTGHPGKTLLANVQVRNTGANDDQYRLTLQAPSGWTASLTPSTLNVAAGETGNALVRAVAPEGGSTTGLFTILVASENIDTRTASLNFASATPQGLTATAAGETDVATESITRGGSLQVSMSVRNAGSREFDICLDSPAVPLGWVVSLPNACAGADQTARLASGATQQFSIFITAPLDASGGSVYGIVVRANATGVPNAFALASYQVRVQTETTIVLDAPATAVLPPSQARCVEATVTNAGTAALNLTLDARLQPLRPGWGITLRFLEDGAAGAPVPQEGLTDYAPGAVRQLCASVTVPAGATPSDAATLTLTARLRGSGAAPLSEVTTRVTPQTFALRLEALAGERTGGPGTTLRLPVLITNQGTGTDTVALEATVGSAAPAGTSAEPSLGPDDASVRTGESTEGAVLVELPVPTNETRPAPGRFDVTILARSSLGNATDRVTVTLELLPYVPLDVDNDGFLEVAIDANANSADGFEAYEDIDGAAVVAGIAGTPRASTLLYSVDADGDRHTEHIVQIPGGPGAYFDPDEQFKNAVHSVFDLTGDGSPEYALDTDFDGAPDTAYDTAARAFLALAALDIRGTGRLEYLVDLDGDGEYDLFADPNQRVTSELRKRGDWYQVDTDDDGDHDTEVNPQDGTVRGLSTTPAEAIRRFWYVPAALGLVVVAFVVYFVRRR